MDVIQLYPHRRYLYKLQLQSIVLSVFLAGGFLSCALQSPVSIVLLIIGCTGAGFVGLLPQYLSYLYYKSLRYEIHQDEIIVYSGFINTSVKHVNFRNITNMELKRSILDQAFKIGSLSIQTAGSGSVVPEETLAGLDNVQEVYEHLATQLRKHQTTDQPSTSTPDNIDNQQIFLQILRELRAIRKLLSND